MLETADFWIQNNKYVLRREKLAHLYADSQCYILRLDGARYLQLGLQNAHSPNHLHVF